MQCAIANISNTILNSSISSSDSESTQQLPKRKARRLRTITCNFQSIWSKKAELENFSTENDVEIVIGTETHLSCNITNAEVIPPTYEAV